MLLCIVYVHYVVIRVIWAR